MIRKILIISLVVLAQGCSTIVSKVPSFWDDNQSARITDVRLAAEQFDCSQPHLAQIQAIRSHIRWFDLYSESKGLRQTDVRSAVKPLADTVEEFWVRTQKSQGSEAYCRIKVKNIQTQAERVSRAVLGRF